MIYENDLTIPVCDALLKVSVVVAASPFAPAIGEYVVSTPVIVYFGFDADTTADVGRTVITTGVLLMKIGHMF
jgi:hypothetical protein